MTKQLIFIFIMLCTVQAQTKAQSAQEDTVRYTSRHAAAELLQPTQPVYLDGVVLPMRGSGNWFVSIAGGTTAFLGTPLGCEDLFGRLKPSYSLAVGKWFTPSVGARINYSGLQFKDARLSTQDYHHIHADLLWNVLGGRYARKEQVRWSLAPFAGVGLLHHATNGHNPFAISYGVQGQYRISKRVSAMLELSGMTTFQDFDGYGRANRLGDHMLSLSAGFTFHIGQTGWKRAIDATSYIRRDEWLTDYANFLSEENNRAKGRIDQDRRTLAELKKILEIEGLLDTYNHLFGNGEATGRQYPVNNYSGLNSLRARLNQSPLTEASDSTSSAHPAAHTNEQIVSQRQHTHHLDSDASQLVSDSLYVGAPIYFFFVLNTGHLTDTSQLINLDGIARIANKHRLHIRVSGAADNATGNETLNNSLGLCRAEYIKAQLIKRAVPSNRIEIVSEGGIDDYSPNEANTNACVRLLSPPK